MAIQNATNVALRVGGRTDGNTIAYATSASLSINMDLRDEVFNLQQSYFDENKDKNLVSRDVSHLFPTSTTYLGIRRDVFLRGFMYDFIEMFIPEYPKQIVKKLMLDQENI